LKGGEIYLSPASLRAIGVAFRAVSLGGREVVDVMVLGLAARDDLLPVDGANVAQVIIVKHADTPAQNV